MSLVGKHEYMHWFISKRHVPYPHKNMTLSFKSQNPSKDAWQTWWGGVKLHQHVLSAIYHVQGHNKTLHHIFIEHLGLSSVESTKSAEKGCSTMDQGVFYTHGSTLNLAWVNNYIQHKVWDEIMYPFLNFNSVVFEVWEWMNSFIPNSTGHVITKPCDVIEKGLSNLITNGVTSSTMNSYYKSCSAHGHSVAPLVNQLPIWKTHVLSLY